MKYKRPKYAKRHLTQHEKVRIIRWFRLGINRKNIFHHFKLRHLSQIPYIMNLQIRKEEEEEIQRQKDAKLVQIKKSTANLKELKQRFQNCLDNLQNGEEGTIINVKNNSVN